MGRRVATGEWDSIGLADITGLPVDLTPGGIPGRPTCWRIGRVAGGIWHAWGCTRPVGHTGRHAAGDGDVIRAVWR